MSRVRVRFDSADSGGAARSWEFGGLQRTVRADRPEEVLPALREVERAAEQGLHAAGFVAYEAASGLDPLLVTGPPDARIPLLWFGLFARREPASPLPDLSAPALAGWTADVSERIYRRDVERIREWIAAGDTYQVNYTFRLRAPFAGDDLALYARLCRAQHAGFCARLHLDDDILIVSASPELFFRWAAGTLELRPMKGTRPRGRWAEEDDRLARELLDSPKERAENLMIVDLLRNDAGRIAEYGSVEVPRLFEVERYPTVHQLTSTVRCRPRNGTTLVDLFRALFPSGSVTGAPKIRTMQIISALERSPRGVYTGAIGFVSGGEAVFSVAIRTLLLDRRRGEAELGVGSGITWDSEADAEFRECFAKAAFTRQIPRRFDLLETLLFRPGAGFPLLDGHLARLSASARYWGYSYNPDAVRRVLEEAVAGAPESACRVRLLLNAAGEPRAERHPLMPSPELLRVAVCPDPVDSSDPLLFHKTTCREVYERRARSRPDCDDVLLVNERGELTEATGANLLVRLGGRLFTPPLAAGLLPGVLRAELLRRGEIEEAVVRPEDLREAEEVLLINSVRGWRRATVVE